MKINDIIERFIYGKNHKNLTKKYKLFFLECLFLSTLFFTCILIFLIIFIFFTKYPLPSKIIIDYSNLTQEEYEIASKIISQVKPLYMAPQRRITFVEDISKKCRDCGKIEDGKKIFGLNRNRKIIIQFVYDETTLKNILCHELLHSFIYTPQEDIVYDVADFYTCFEDENNPILEKNLNTIELDI